MYSNAQFGVFLIKDIKVDIDTKLLPIRAEN